MGVFRTSKPRRTPANPTEVSAENTETLSQKRLLGTRYGFNWFSRQSSSQETISNLRRRALADPEDDAAETQLIDEERRGESNY